MKFVQQFPIAGQKGDTSFQSENCWASKYNYIKNKYLVNYSLFISKA